MFQGAKCFNTSDKICLRGQSVSLPQTEYVSVGKMFQYLRQNISQGVKMFQYLRQSTSQWGKMFQYPHIVYYSNLF